MKAIARGMTDGCWEGRESTAVHDAERWSSGGWLEAVDVDGVAFFYSCQQAAGELGPD